MSDISNREGRITITIVTAYEILKGAYLSSDREYNLKNAKAAISSMQVLDLSSDACEEASRIFCELKKSGTMISEFDILIAAIAKINGEAILSRDQHFRSIKGIDLVQF